MRRLVIDASAVVEVLLDTSQGKALAQTLDRPEADLHAPALCDLEVTSALRTGIRRELFSAWRAEEALQDYLDLPLSRHGHEGLVHRCFQLRDVLTPYDAAYVALAEDLGADLVTADRRLARTAEILGVSCRSA